MAGGANPRSFAFGPFVLLPDRQLLLQGDVPVRIGSRALDLLTALVELPGEVVSKRELMARAWPNVIVHEDNLKVNMGALRRALGDGGDTAKYIATVSGRGYRFVEPVQTSAASPSPLASAAPYKHNLPTGTTRIFGRADAIDAIRRELDKSRLVSIVGTGGIGKTTVAHAVMEHAIGAFEDGVWLVDLALLRDAALVPNAIATAIGLAANSANMLAALCEYLRGRKMLLVLDNCEHVIDVATSCANRILAEAAAVKILVTTREPLRAKGERVQRLAGLGTPPPSARLSAEEARTFPAIQLFVDRATDRLESFELKDVDAPIVSKICRRLDGLALAIELAATRVDVFDVRSLLQQLDDRPELLSGRRAGPERQRTLKATLDWSYGLLPENEAALLRAVSVFAGVFDIDGASAVADIARTEAVLAVAELVAKSLLAVDLDGEDVSYRLLETTRAYCQDKLHTSGEGENVRRRHAEHVRAVLQRAANEWAQRPSREWGAAYRHILDDLRNALVWLASDATNQLPRIQLTVEGSVLWNHFSLTEECRVHASQAVEQLEAAGLAGTTTEMKLQLSLAGAIMFTQGPIPQVITALQNALNIADQTDDADYRLRCLRMIGVYELLTGNHEAGIRTLETFASVAATADPGSVPDGEAQFACAEILLGRLKSALRRLENLKKHHLQDFNSLQFARFLYGRNTTIGNNLSHVQWLTGLPDSAARTAEATIAYAIETRHELSHSNTIAYACPVFFLSGRYEECSRQVAALSDLVLRHGIVSWRPLALFYRSALECAQNGGPGGMYHLERAIAEFRAIGHLARMPFYLSILAETFTRHGRLSDANETILDAFECVNVQSEKWCLPEVLRVKAGILAAQGNADAAEAALVESITFAGNIGALSWQLRTANDLAQLWLGQSRAVDARAVLLPIYSRFTEGFTTRDLAVADELLARV